MARSDLLKLRSLGQNDYSVMVQIAKGLRRRKRWHSLRAIAADLAARGYVNVNGRAFSAASVASMLGA